MTEANNLKANLTWVHLFCDFVQSGAIAKMGANAFAVLMAVKSHAAMNDGISCPSADTIAQYVGLSRRQVMRELARLVSDGRLTKVRTQRASLYRLTERIQLTNDEGTPMQTAQFPYAPLTVEQIRKEIKKYLESGELAAGSPIVIQQLNVNVVVGGTMNNFNVPTTNLDDIKDPRLRAKFEAMIERAKTCRKD
jgi:AraC-like DNA-binding protein